MYRAVDNFERTENAVLHTECCYNKVNFRDASYLERRAHMLKVDTLRRNDYVLFIILIALFHAAGLHA